MGLNRRGFIGSLLGVVGSTALLKFPSVKEVEEPKEVKHKGFDFMDGPNLGEEGFYKGKNLTIMGRNKDGSLDLKDISDFHARSGSRYLP
jgi:hypothetical protein